MRIRVQKFGGTSVATEESRSEMIKKIKQSKDDGDALVIVVSAMGRSGDPYATDTLLDLIRSKYKNYNKRELDMAFACGEILSAALVASILNDMGLPAIALSGQQAGILSDDNFFDANIISIDPSSILKYLSAGLIVIVTGGQAANSDGDITTLGRGGSDTSAVALANALDAYETVIYTDVIGIMTTDPRIVSCAKIIKKINFINCLKLAEEGAKVIHPRAVGEAMNKPEIALYVRSTFSNDMGTYIGNNDEITSPQAQGITMKKLYDSTTNETKITIVGNQIDLLETEIIRSIENANYFCRDIELKNNYLSFVINEDTENKVIKNLHYLLFEK